MDDLTWMRLAAQAAAQVHPENTFENPRVGAVIVKDNRLLAVGRHEFFGSAHAEMNAFKQLKHAKDAVGATLYVTLEPCAVHGKMGSCADAIQQWGLARVVVGDIDPNPTTHGLGIQKLQYAGIQVDILHTADSRQLNPAFYQYHTTGQPYIQLKLAQSQDGFVTSAIGQRSKLTDDLTDLDVHRQRACHSAILIGSDTLLIDEPELTVRHIKLLHEQPLRIVVDRRGRLQGNPVIKNKQWLVYTENQQFAQQSHVVFMQSGLSGVISDLGKRGVQSLMVEGGPTILQAFLEAKLWHEFICYTTAQQLHTGLPSIVLPQLPADSQRIGQTTRTRYFNQEVATCLQALHKQSVI